MSTRIDEIVDDIFALVGLSCILVDTELKLVSYSTQSDIDSLRNEAILRRGASQEATEALLKSGSSRLSGPSEVPSTNFEGESTLPRIVVPIVERHRTLGTLWLIRSESTDVGRTIAAIAEHIEQLRLLLRYNLRVKENLAEGFRELIEGTAADSSFTAARVAQAGGFSPQETVVICKLSNRTIREPLFLPKSTPGALWMPATDHDLFLITRPKHIEDATDVNSLVANVAPSAINSHDWGRFDCGIGESVRGFLQLRRSAETAEVALRVAKTTKTTGFKFWSDLGALRILLNLNSAEVAQYLLPTASCVGRFVHEGPEDLLDTALVYLNAGASPSRAAELLNLHRQTLYQRLKVIEKIAGIDLNQGGDRVELHLSLLLKPLLQEEPSPSTIY